MSCDDAPRSSMSAAERFTQRDRIQRTPPEPVLKHKAPSLEESSLRTGFPRQVSCLSETWTEISPRRVGKHARAARQNASGSRLALATSQRHAAKPEPRSLRRHERSFLLYSPYSFFDELSLSVPMLLKLFFLEQFLHSLCLFYPAPRASRWLPIGGESLHRSGEIVFVHFATIPPIEL